MLQYYELQDKVYKRYTKTILGGLSGIRCNPHNITERVPFVLVTPESAVKYVKDKDDYDVIDGKNNTDYEKEVLEVYSPEEDRVFRQLNRLSIEKGLLVEYKDKNVEINTTNELSDDGILEIARAKNPLVLKSKVKDITSPVTLQRIRDKLNELDKSKGYIKVIDDRLEDVTNKSTA